MCSRKAIKKDWIEEIVLKHVVETLLDDKLINQIADRIINAQVKDNEDGPLLKKQLEVVDRNIENLIDAIQDGLYNKSTKDRLDKLEDRKAELEIAIVKDKIQREPIPKEYIIKWIHNLRNIDTSDYIQKERLIDAFVNAVYVYDDKIVFTFNCRDGTEAVSIERIEDKCSDLKAVGVPNKSSCMAAFCISSRSYVAFANHVMLILQVQYDSMNFRSRVGIHFFSLLDIETIRRFMMAYCSKCGSEILDNAVFCSNCGSAVSETGQQQTSSNAGTQSNEESQSNAYGQGQPNNDSQSNAYGQGQPNNGPQSNAYGQGQSAYVRPNINYDNPAQDAQINKAFGILAYLGFLVFITILAAPKESHYSRFHANQGLVLFIADIAGAIVLRIITAILTVVSGVIGFGAFTVFGLIGSLLWAAYGIILLILIIKGIVNALNGKLEPLPIIGRIQILK